MTTNNETQALLRLMTWLSPAFPVGAFAYSGGLEAAVRERHVTNAEELSDWLNALLRNGPVWNDAVLLTEAWLAVDDAERLSYANELAVALAGSAERYLETTAQGAAFLEAASAWQSPAICALNEAVAYPISVGATAAANRVPLDETLTAYLHALASQLVSAAIRCGVLGQKQGVAILVGLEPVILDAAECASRSTLDDLGSATMMADLMAIRHETIGTRLFRS